MRALHVSVQVGPRPLKQAGARGELDRRERGRRRARRREHACCSSELASALQMNDENYAYGLLSCNLCWKPLQAGRDARSPTE